MSRYSGPRIRVMRALGVDLPGLSPKTADRRPYPPGQHGQRRRKETEFGKRLKEKQKLRMNYGLSEAQLRNIFREALHSNTNTGERLIQLLERRLDNVIFRAGFARSIPAARQLVNHGHVVIGGGRVDIPSFRVRAGQQISIRASSANIAPVVDGLALLDTRRWDTPWLEIDREQRSIRVTRLPEPESILFPLEVQLVIEFYAQNA